MHVNKLTKLLNSSEYANIAMTTIQYTFILSQNIEKQDDFGLNLKFFHGRRKSYNQFDVVTPQTTKQTPFTKIA